MKMNSINTTQVKLTNDASTVSKCSAVSKCYFRDDFIEEFVERKKTRTSLIHLGYYTRTLIMNKLITYFIEFVNRQQFLKFQIISCGSGFDTTYWKLSKEDLLNKSSLFVEIDFSDVIQRKISLINKSEKLRSYIDQSHCCQPFPGVNKMNFNYYLLEVDLSDLNLMEKLFNEINIDYDTPTLILSECVITYMKEVDSRKLIKWMAEKFKNCVFINYEQIHPYDGFGQVMLKHFDKLQSSLFSVTEYPDCKSHYLRYRNLGFKNSFCIPELTAFYWLATEEERRRLFSLELFDEFEEFHLKCVHYIVAIAGNGIFSDWLSEFPPTENQLYLKHHRTYVKADRLPCELELFRHSSCSVNGSSFLFGGCSKQNRSSKTYKIKHSEFSDVKDVKNSGNNIQLDMVYGTAVSFEINKVPFVCLYGGRRSPNKIWNNGSTILFELIDDDELFPRLVISDGNPIPRYRSPMVCLKTDEGEAHCWIFGGRTTDIKQSLSDFWELSIKCDNEKNIASKWKPYERKNESWPCSRMSHSFSACPNRFQLFIVGGLAEDLESVLNDMWIWCCRSESWSEVYLAGNLLPRYGHTAHLKDDTIYLVGGVNTLEGAQPCLGVIDLEYRTVTEYAVTLSVPDPLLLFNHTSELVGDGDDAHICVIGGGGNCFSFGTYLNQFAVSIKLNQLRPEVLGNE